MTPTVPIRRGFRPTTHAHQATPHAGQSCGCVFACCCDSLFRVSIEVGSTSGCYVLFCVSVRTNAKNWLKQKNNNTKIILTLCIGIPA